MLWWLGALLGPCFPGLFIYLRPCYWYWGDTDISGSCFILLFTSKRNWSVLTLSWLDLTSSWCSNILSWHLRTDSEDLPNRSWASHSRLDSNEWSKDGNCRNIILSVSVSHNLFVSNRMPSGDCLEKMGGRVWDTPHHLCSHWMSCCGTPKDTV